MPLGEPSGIGSVSKFPREAWRATVHGIEKIHDLTIKQHQINTNNYTAGKWSQPGVGKLWPTGKI